MSSVRKKNETKNKRAKFLRNVVSYILRKPNHAFNQKRSIKTGFLCLQMVTHLEHFTSITEYKRYLQSIGYEFDVCCRYIPFFLFDFLKTFLQCANLPKNGV